jgi:type VI secretion system protein ImpG
MRDELLDLYEKELDYVRRLGAEFADKYPKIAGRLQLERDKCEDPHVERLLEAFAFLTARVRLKLEDDFPELTDALLGVVYPHYTAPVPSMSIVQFVTDPDKGKLTSGYSVPRGATVLSRPVGGIPCKFRTCYPTTIWPLEIVSASLLAAPFGFQLPAGSGEAAAGLRLELKTLGGVKLAELVNLDRLRFFLDGPPSTVFPLFELLFGASGRIVLRPGEKQKNLRPIVLPNDCLKPVGFGRDEGMLEYPARSFLGYRLLQEYFTFPDKFKFFEVEGLDRAVHAKYTDRLEIFILLNRSSSSLENVVAAENFRPACTPVVNLFRQSANPIALSGTKTEYPIHPDLRHPMAHEIHSIDAVTGTSPGTRDVIDVLPFYSFKHSYDREEQKVFWYAVRRPSIRKNDPGTDMSLLLVDLGFRPSRPSVDTLGLKLTCTNRDLPAKLPFEGKPSDFELEGGGPLAGISCLRKPTPTLRPALRRGAQWRLISHLSLNYLSVSDPTEGRDALREILRLYDFTDSAAVRRQIAGITAVSSRSGVARTGREATAAFVRGVELTVEFDEENFVGSGVFLFAGVLERFLGLYTSINSFCRVTAKTKQREGILKRWPARAGEQTLL